MTPSNPISPIIDATTIMIYGASGSTKTTQLYFIAKWLWEKHNLRTRLIVSDPGGYAPFIDSGMIEKGIVQIFDYRNRPLALADIRRLSKGYWPRTLVNGDTAFMTDDRFLTTPEEWKGIGAYMMDGMSSTADILKSHCLNQPGNTVGFKEAWEYIEDGEVIRGSQMGHYGIVQDEISRLHRTGFSCLPVKYVIWTAQVGKGEEKKVSRLMEYGPQLAGSALTPYIPSWFQHCLHLDTQLLPNLTLSEDRKSWVQGEGTHIGKVAWFTDHYDDGNPSTGIRFITKTRVLPEKIPILHKQFPFGCVELNYTRGIDKYLEVIDKLKG